MNKLYAIDNFKTQNWELDIKELGAFYNDLHIGFIDTAPIISFNNLTFGFELKQNEIIIQSGIYPPPNVKYFQTNQKHLVAVRIETLPTETYELFLWAKNDNTRIEKRFTLEIPKPPKTFKSWVWNEEKLQWESPIPYPQDNKEYIWNESEQEWTYTGYYLNENDELVKE